MWDILMLQLDLCILAYQLHSQSLIWPADPYYEQLLKHGEGTGRRRQEFIAEVATNFKSPRTGTVQLPNPNAVYRGPGACMGWGETNPTLDPIISDYDRINPWRPCFVRPLRHRDPWLVYNAPTVITSRIGRVLVAKWTGSPYVANSQRVLDELTAAQQGQPARLQPPANAQDWLYCFEGATGADTTHDSDKRWPAWSLMGFVLVRQGAAPQNYDVHIAFRGSRSGKLRPTQAGARKGNPDWVTDLQLLTDPVTDRDISQLGKVARGFGESLKMTLPTIMGCLDHIHAQKNGPPGNIYVTGHSLGGALACHFASAVILGRQYAYTNPRGAMSANVRAWPWRNMTVATFGSPAVGDAAFSRALSPVHCTRVWILADPITTVNPAGHVGTSVCLAPPPTDTLSPGQRHDPEIIRKYVAQEYQQYVTQQQQANAGFVPVYIPPAFASPTDQPWKYFHDCLAMVGHLRFLQNYTPADVFKDYIPNLTTYLQILVRVLGQRSLDAQQAAGELPGIIAALSPNPQPATATAYYTSLETAWNGANHLRNYDDRLHGYIGLCLYLATCTKGQVGQLFLLPPPDGALKTALYRF